MDLSSKQMPNSRTLMLTQGISPYAQRIAKRYLSQWPLVFASSVAVPQPLLDTGNHVHIPSADHSSFVHVLLKACLDHQVSYMLPLGQEEALALRGAKILFEEYGIEVLVSDPYLAADSAGENEPNSELPIMLQPPRELELLILSKGEVLSPPDRANTKLPARYSGVFTFNDDGQGYQCYA